MKKLLSVLLVLFVVTCAFAQGNSSLADPDPSIIGADSARQALKEVSVDLFEREGAWKAKISPDCGIISARLFDGAPAAKEPIDDAENQQLVDEKVLGIKVEFFRRGVNSFYVTSARPLAIEGVLVLILNCMLVHLILQVGKNLQLLFRHHQMEFTELYKQVHITEISQV